ncbi:MAG: GNAT family N-acetyltransferase [Rhodospirillales bacterium]|jgi:GNAT superfamily N-acetyltransferase|nr:GNAT family N-acetyltransferase [Rhodospirillales bacterium]MDP6773359.1 GNAT family N-acetyltransferase [Rhodospirillales bacterium]
MIHIRQAVKEDSAEIARLFLISSDGLAEYIWSKVGGPGETVIEAGARRYARQGVAFSYENCLIAEREGDTVGMAHGFGMEEDPDAEPESDPVLKPYSELEDYGSLYLSAMAVVEQYRNAGIGAALMEAVNRRARGLSLRRISLICFERNVGAMRLYRKLGFRELDRRAVVPHPTLHYRDGDAVLLARECSPPEL